MKKIFIFFCLIFLFAGCKKCAECTEYETVTINTPTPGYPQKNEQKFEACGDEIETQDGKITEWDQHQGNIIITHKTIIDCE